MMPIVPAARKNQFLRKPDETVYETTKRKDSPHTTVLIRDRVYRVEILSRSMFPPVELVSDEKGISRASILLPALRAETGNSALDRYPRIFEMIVR